jgi:protein-tyrosine-phosphatase
MNVLFVCTGNTCRSPMAEAILRDQQIDDITVKSAGIFAAEGNNASAHAIKVLEENKINHSHRSRMLGKEDILWADYVFTMTEGHKTLLMDHYPFGADKIFTLKEFVYETKEDMDVIDPYGGSMEVYQETFYELKRLVEGLLEKIGESN